MNISDEQALDPFPFYAMMRQNSPVMVEPQYRSINVFKYDDVQRVLSEHATFSSERADPSGDKDAINSSIISLDPPRHRKLRNIVTQAFTPRAVTRMENRISELVEEMLTPIKNRNRMDMIDDLAYPLPVTVIAEMMGIPTQDQEKFKNWSDQIIGNSSGNFAQAQIDMAQYFGGIIEQRRREPQDDLISNLITAQVDGEHLSLQEIVGFCILLLVAGNETTTNLIGNAILCFEQHPEAWEELRSDASLVPSAVEEVLRYLSPVQCMFRITVADTTLGDQEITKGQWVTAWIGSANRDSDQFPNPDTFDIRRTPNRHIAFGHGIHFCLGAPLARLEGRITFEALRQTLPQIHRDQSVQLEKVGSFFVYGVKHLPLILK